MIDLGKEITKYAEENNDHKWSGYLRISGISRCARAISYNALGYDSLPTPGRSMMIMQDGNLHEEDIVERLELAGIHISNRQREVGDKKTLVGHIDGEVNIEGRTYLLEIKSMNHFGFMKLCDEGLKESNPGYYTQMQMYMDWGGYGAGIILVKNKNNGNIYSSVIEKDTMAILLAEERVQWLEEGIQDSKLLKREHFRDSWQCAACSYKHHCWPEECAAIDVDEMDLRESVALWREGHVFEKRGSDMVKAAKDVFENYSRKYQTAIECNGVTVKMSSRSRTSISVEDAKAVLDEKTFNSLVKTSEYNVLSIKDKGGA